MMTKINVLSQKYYKSIYEPVRTSCSSCGVKYAYVHKLLINLPATLLFVADDVNVQIVSMLYTFNNQPKKDYTSADINISPSKSKHPLYWFSAESR